jgi:hypothetical protein
MCQSWVLIDYRSEFGGVPQQYLALFSKTAQSIYFGADTFCRADFVESVAV